VSGRDPIDADEEWVEVQDTGPERNLRVERRDPIDVLRDALLEGEHCLNALWEVKDALRKLPDDLAKKINEVDFEEALEALAVLERQLAEQTVDLRDLGEELVAAEAALAEANQQARDLADALRQIASDIHPPRPEDEERPRWMTEDSFWWNHYSPQEIARAALAGGQADEEPTT
jgi:uncharacterized coiled-coil protein SlyX